MERNEHDKITAFDTLFTTNHIQMMKIVMPYLDTPMRKKLAVYIKYQELCYTLSYYSTHSIELCGCSIDSMEKEDFNISKLCSEILPFCTTEEKQKVEQLAGMFRSIEMYREMSQTFEMMKDFAPGMGENAGSDDGMMDMLLNMLSPEQKSMFDMFGGKST